MQGRPATQNNTSRSVSKRDAADPKGIVFDTTERRFKQKGLTTHFHQHGTNMHVGPGTYGSREGSMMKKSFNMSMEQSHFI